MSVPVDYESMTTEQLFEEYQRAPNDTLKWEIALRYTGLIKNVALQIRGVYCSFTQLDDIINEGVIVLADTVDKYDPSKGKFDTFVTKRIRGMIIDLARQQDWVPRAVRRRAKEIERVNGELYQKLGRFPTDKESAEALGITEQEYQETLCDAALHNVISLEELFDGYEPMVEQPGGGTGVATPDQVLQSRELVETLTKAISSLKKNEQMVLSLYYQKGLKMKEIAAVMNVSAPRVSQVHAKAIQKLRILMDKYMNEPLPSQTERKGKGRNVCSKAFTI